MKESVRHRVFRPARRQTQNLRLANLSLERLHSLANIAQPLEQRLEAAVAEVHFFDQSHRLVAAANETPPGGPPVAKIVLLADRDAIVVVVLFEQVAERGQVGPDPLENAFLLGGVRQLPGFDVAHAMAGSAGHFGLLGMHERAENIRGRFTVCSAPGQGTEIAVAVKTAKRSHREAQNEGWSLHEGEPS